MLYGTSNSEGRIIICDLSNYIKKINTNCSLWYSPHIPKCGTRTKINGLHKSPFIFVNSLAREANKNVSHYPTQKAVTIRNISCNF